MSGVLNDCDALLQAAIVRIVNPKNASIILTPTAPAFHLNAAGAADIASITINATVVGLDGDLSFSAQGATLTGPTGRAATITLANMQGLTAIVTASMVSGGVTFSQSCIIATLQDGADGDSGARGAGMYFASGSAWSDGTADAATPGGNVTGDVVTISNGSTYSMTKKWSGTAWVVMGAVFHGDLFVTGSINGAALKVGTVEIRDTSGNLILGAGAALAQQIRMSPNLVPNAMSWKYFSNGAGAYGGSANTANGEYLNLPAIADVTVMAETDIYLPAAGGTFTISCLANGLNAGADIVFDIIGNPGINLRPLFVGLTTAQQRFTATFSIPANTYGLRLRAYTGSGKGAQAADIKLEQGSFATAWTSNVITAQNATTFVQAGAFGTMSAYAAYVGSMEIGPGGNIRQGMTDYGVGVGMWFGQHNGINKFIVGNPNGAMMWWDGNTLQTKGLSITAPVYAAFSVSIGGDISGGGSGKAITIGTRTATIVGAGNLKSVSWVVTDQNGAGISVSNATSQTATFRSNTGTTPASGSAVVTCTIVGHDGRTHTDSVMAYSEHM